MITENDFIEVNITNEMLEEAKSRNESFKNKYGSNGTHRTNKENQRIVGYLAEVAINKCFKSVEYVVGDDNIDFISKNKKVTLDSKAQGCNGMPKIDYVATLYEEQNKRPVDMYIFSRVKNDFTKVWICGFISKKDYIKYAKLMPKGTKNNNFTYDNSRYELEYSKLHNPNILT